MPNEPRIARGQLLPDFKAKYGEPLVVRDCGSLNPGDKCQEYRCINGYKLVIYCNRSEGCTDAREEPC